MTRNIHRILLLLAGLSAASCGGPVADTTEPAILAEELEEHVRWIAADERGGRESGTPGADETAAYLANEFQRYGLDPAGDAGSYLQAFSFPSGTQVGEGNKLAAGEGPPLVLGSDWRPLSFSDDGSGDFPLLFAGYGIHAPDEGWDDYAGQDVEGKAVLVVPYAPPAAEGGMMFPRWHTLRRKASAARDLGAAALIVAPHPVHDPPGYLEPLRSDAAASASGIVAASVTLPAADRLLGEGTSPLRDLVETIDHEGVPRPLETGRQVSLEVDVDPVQAEGFNVLGALPAGSASAPWVIIGAHYDHLGMGGEGSMVPDSAAVHNGADDNASGTAVLLELAQHFAADPVPGRNILFAAFAAEERGLLGSAYLADHLPGRVGPVEAMINMDMVGRLTEQSLTVYGTETSPAWNDLLQEINGRPPYGFTLSTVPDGYGPSDHASFYAKEIPVLHFFTGTHAEYHRPEDDPETLNYRGMEELGTFIAGLVRSRGEHEEVLAFQKAEQPRARRGGRADISVYSGVIPDMAYQGEGLRLTGVREDSPSAMAGLEGGDIIVRMGERTIKDIYDYMYALEDHSPGERVEVEALRDGRRITVQVVLASSRSR
ncbi:MAG: M28 family peptidase [bacterium]